MAKTCLTEVGHEAAPADDEAPRIHLYRARYDEAALATRLETGDIPDEKCCDQ